MRLLLLSASLLSTPITASLANAQAIERNSVSSMQLQANAPCRDAAISGDGRYVVFVTVAPSLIAGATGTEQVLIRDRREYETTLVSIPLTGLVANADCREPSISNDGRFVAFSSLATNLAVETIIGARDIFVRDCISGSTVIASIATSGAQAGGHCSQPSISGDGRFVAFTSIASLDPGDNNSRDDVYVRDLVAGTTTWVSIPVQGVALFGSSNPDISANGAVVSFESRDGDALIQSSSPFMDIFVRDLASGVTTSPTNNPNWIIAQGDSSRSTLSGDGRFLVFQSAAANLLSPPFPPDTNQNVDCFIFDRTQGPAVGLVSCDSSGVQFNNGGGSPSISDDANYATFTSNQGLCHNAASQVYLRNLLTGVTACTTAVQPSGPSAAPEIASALGLALVAFESDANNLVQNDTNAVRDIFTFALPPAFGHQLYCTAKTNSNGCTPYINAWGVLSATGPDDFVVGGHEVLNNKTGIMIWSKVQGAIPLGGGTLCVAPPIKRIAGQSSFGTPGPLNCTGRYEFPIDQAYAASNGIVPGVTINFQIWSRDPVFAAPNNVGLTNGLSVVMQP